MNEVPNSTRLDDWIAPARSALRDPKALPVICPLCGVRAVNAAWHLLDFLSRKALIDLNCLACKATQTLTINLPADAPGFFPFDRVTMLTAKIQDQIAAIGSRIQQHAQKMPAAAFTTSPLWQEANWIGTTFVWHPTSESPPAMGIVFEKAAPARKLFQELIDKQGQGDRFEELRISIIEGSPPGQPDGYTIHFYPDPDSLSAYATAEDFVLDPQVVPFLGQWNRSFPPRGKPSMLAKFKEEFAKHKEFMLCPVIPEADGQHYAQHKLGIIKSLIEFRNLADLRPDDVDAGAIVMPHFIKSR